MRLLVVRAVAGSRRRRWRRWRSRRIVRAVVGDAAAHISTGGARRRSDHTAFRLAAREGILGRQAHTGAPMLRQALADRRARLVRRRRRRGRRRRRRGAHAAAAVASARTVDAVGSRENQSSGLSAGEARALRQAEARLRRRRHGDVDQALAGGFARLIRRRRRRRRRGWRRRRRGGRRRRRSDADPRRRVDLYAGRAGRALAMAAIVDDRRRRRGRARRRRRRRRVRHARRTVTRTRRQVDRMIAERAVEDTDADRRRRRRRRRRLRQRVMPQVLQQRDQPLPKRSPIVRRRRRRRRRRIPPVPPPIGRRWRGIRTDPVLYGAGYTTAGRLTHVVRSADLAGDATPAGGAPVAAGRIRISGNDGIRRGRRREDRGGGEHG